MGTKLDSYFNTADSNAIYWRADSVVMAKYKGTARALAFDVSGGYVPYTGATQNVTIGNFRVSARTLLGDSIMARTSAGVSVYSNSGTQVALFGAGGGSGTTLYGGLNGTTGTFSGDLSVNNIRIGRGIGNVATNTVVGNGALNSATGSSSNNSAFGYESMRLNTSGFNNTANGFNSLYTNTTGYRNSAFGHEALYLATTGFENTAVGTSALRGVTSASGNIGIGFQAGEFFTGSNQNTSPSNSIFIGNNTAALGNSQTNQIVIGHNTTGNGSNTVTIGNSSVTQNYFRGTLNTSNSNSTVELTQISDTATVIGTDATSTSSAGLFLRGFPLLFSGNGSTGTSQMRLTSNGNLIIDTAYDDGVNKLRVNGRAATKKITARDVNNPQLEAYGWNNTQGATDVGGEIRIGSFSTFQGRAWYSGAGSGTLYLDNSADEAGSDIILRTRTSGTAVDALRLTATSAKFNYLGTGTVYSNSGTLTNTDPSDSTIKNTINPHKYGLAEILKLEPKSFYYNSDSTKSSLKYGFIAQEVEKIMPDMVRKIDPKDENSKLGLESQGIYVTMVKAIQEQQAIIEALLKRIELLEKR
jgi:hypothetical protein